MRNIFSHLSILLPRRQRFIVMMMAVSIGLTACTTMNPNSSVTPATQSAESLDTWRLVGRVALVSPRDNGSASLRWQQRHSDFRVDVVAPLNAVSLRVTGNATGVKFAQGDQTIDAANLEDLERQMSAQAVPFANLKYWIRGLPHPDRPVSAAKKASAGYYQAFTQAGWQLQLTQYQNVNGYVLPTRLVATNVANPAVKIIVSVNQWLLAGS